MATREAAVYVWDFTIKYVSDDQIDTVKNFLKEVGKKWCFQLERGATGYEHLQGRVSLKVRSRKAPFFPDTYWSVTSTENRDNMFYVTKDETRIKGPWSDKDAYVPKQVRDIELYQWQQDILDDANKWDTRTINCVVCPTGNIGKSTLTVYAGARGLARSLPMMDSYKDLMRMVMDCPKSRLYLIDFPRSMNKMSCAAFWSAVETVKNGYAYDDRYSFREEYFDCPNIWVFCNSFPDTNFLSIDRWKFWEVTAEKQLQALRCNNSVAAGTIGTTWSDIFSNN